MTVLLTAGGTIAVAAGGLLTALALVRIVILGDAEEADYDADSPSTERVDRIAAAIALAVLGVALIVLGFLWG